MLEKNSGDFRINSEDNNIQNIATEFAVTFSSCSRFLLLESSQKSHQLTPFFIQISEVFLDHQKNFFLTVGQINFGNKTCTIKRTKKQCKKKRQLSEVHCAAVECGTASIELPLENFWPSASNFKSFSQSLEELFSHSRSDQFWKQNLYHKTNKKTMQKKEATFRSSLCCCGVWNSLYRTAAS